MDFKEGDRFRLVIQSFDGFSLDVLWQNIGAQSDIEPLNGRECIVIGEEGFLLTIHGCDLPYVRVEFPVPGESDEDYWPCWAVYTNWLEPLTAEEPLAPCLVGRDVPGYTDTYVPGDEFLRITRMMSEGHGGES